MSPTTLKLRGMILACVIVLAGLSSCKKKDRLTASTFRFAITPPAASVIRTNTLTLSAFSSSSAGTLSVSPSWAVSPTTVGTLSNSIGTSVVFTPVSLGTAVVTATFEGIEARAEINVVTYIPSASVYNVYNDDGLPSNVPPSVVDIFVDPGVSLSEVAIGYTPEGVNYQRATGMSTGEFWGITFDDNNVAASRNLSNFDGTLKFSLRLVNRTLASIGGGDHLRVEVQTVGSAATPVSLTSGSYGFNRLSQDWQEIAIPITDFVGLDTTQIENSFAIVAVALNSSLDFDIDAIRWEP